MRKIGREERAVVLILYPMMANFVVMGAALPFVYQPMPGSAPPAAGGDRGASAGGNQPADLRLSHGNGGDRGADAVFADHLGHGLRVRVLRRGAGIRATLSVRRSSWPRASTSCSGSSAAGGRPPRRSCARARASSRPRCRASHLPHRKPSGPTGTITAPAHRPRLTPLQRPRVGAIPRGTVGV
jgi:hypothetical protein